MGCCQTNLEIGEMAISSLDNLNIHDPRLTQTEEGFGDLSLDSHQDSDYQPIFESTKTRLGDSTMYISRSKSISLHRTDIESAFLQSSGALKKISLNARNEDSEH